MEQPLYDIYFTGQLVDGTETDTGKTNLATLFKRSPEQIAHFFDGRAHLLKRGIDKPGALKYKATLHKAGLLVVVKAHRPASAPVESATSTEPAPSTATDSNIDHQQQDWSLAPAGSDVLKASERKPVAERSIDTSSIKMVSAFMDPEPESKPYVAAPNTSQFSLAATGADLLETKPAATPAPALNIDDISLAPPGTELEELHPEVTALNPDTSQLSLAAAGADLLEGQTKTPPPPPPNIDHLAVKPD